MYEENSVSVQFNICTNTGSSEVVGRRIGGRQEEAKHAVECSVKSVGQLDRFEEEEKPPEVASNGEGDVSDENLGEIDEGLLEHAMYSDLLNDDDRELFPANIARIQRTPME